MSEIVLKIERVKKRLLLEKRVCDVHHEDCARLQKDLLFEQQRINALVSGQEKLRKEHLFWQDRVSAEQREADTQLRAIERLRLQRASLIKELNHSNAEKQELESSIRADEDIIAGLERSATQLADQIEIANNTRMQLKQETQRQKELMDKTDTQIEEINAKMLAMRTTALSSLNASRVLVAMPSGASVLEGE